MIALVLTKYFLLVLAISFLLVITIEVMAKIFTSQIHASKSNSYFIPSTQLFQFIKDVDNYPSWRNGVINIEKQPSENSWMESFGKHQNLQLIASTATNGELIFKIQSTENHPFLFNRQYTVYRKDKLSFLKIEDQIKFSSAPLILFARFFYDHSKIIQQELKNLDQILS